MVISELFDDAGVVPGSGLQLREEAANKIRGLILSGHLESGTKLKPMEIAQALRMSVTPVREAFAVLAGQGFLRTTPRRGFEVAPLSSQDFADMYRLYALLSGEFARRFAEKASDEELDELIGILDAQELAGRQNNSPGFERGNFEFHRFINRRADSPRLSWVVNLVLDYIPLSYYGNLEGMASMSIHDHREVVEAFKKRDPDLAERAMRDHIDHSTDFFLKLLDFKPKDNQPERG